MCGAASTRCGYWPFGNASNTADACSLRSPTSAVIGGGRLCGHEREQEAHGLPVGEHRAVRRKAGAEEEAEHGVRRARPAA